jgi:Protein of unknown function (DUF3379)
MIDHSRYRWLMIADPRSAGSDPELAEHAAQCAECRAFTERLLRFESRLEGALKVNLPAGSNVVQFGPRRAGAASSAPRRWLALAASVVLGLVVAGALWIGAPERTLAAAVVGHMTEEPNAWARTDHAVAEPKLELVLKASGVHLGAAAGMVSYASSCSFRGHHVPHLVVQSPQGPVTVMVLTHEPVRRAMHFDEEGYRGTLVPVPGHGSLAVLMRGQADPKAIDAIAAQVKAAVSFDP